MSTPPNIRALKLELTISVGELEDLCMLLYGALEVLEERGDEIPPIYTEMTAQYEGLMSELSDATRDLFGVE